MSKKKSKKHTKSDKLFYATVLVIMVIAFFFGKIDDSKFEDLGGYDTSVQAYVTEKKSRQSHLKNILHIEFHYKNRHYKNMKSGVCSSVFDKVEIGDVVTVSFNHAYPEFRQITVKCQ